MKTIVFLRVCAGLLCVVGVSGCGTAPAPQRTKSGRKLVVVRIDRPLGQPTFGMRAVDE